jgi:quinol monooxygenase YgiN
MYTQVHVTLTVAPEDLSHFIDVLKEYSPRISGEPENVSYDMCVSQETPGVVRLVETWSKDRKWIEEVRPPLHRVLAVRSMCLWTDDCA